MNSKLKIAGGAVAGLVVLAIAGVGGFYGWAISARSAHLAKTWDVPPSDFPVPWPLTDEEIAALRTERAAALASTAPADPAAPPVDPATLPDPLAGVDLTAIAKERAMARAEHLLSSRYACNECHGKNFAGGVMVDAPPVGTFHGPNITAGKGGKTASYTPQDWDRIVRHGVKPDGSTAMMPAIDFAGMSDQELSDIVTYITAQPPVDNETVPLSFGPVMNIVIATGEAQASAYLIDHARAHPKAPPPEAPDATFGEHLMQTCTGCHGTTLSGGPIKGGDPAWPPAANLTPKGQEGKTYEDFAKVMREGKKKDGSELQKPMSDIIPYSSKFTDVEVQAMWAHLQSLPPLETGAR